MISPCPANQCYFSQYCRTTLIRCIKVSSILMLWPQSCRHLCICTGIIDVEFLLKPVRLDLCWKLDIRDGENKNCGQILYFVIRENFLFTAKIFKIGCQQMEARVLHKIRSEPIISSKQNPEGSGFFSCQGKDELSTFIPCYCDWVRYRCLHSSLPTVSAAPVAVSS